MKNTIRAIIDGKVVYGQYCNLAGSHYIAEYPVGAERDVDGMLIGGWIEITIATAAVFTGKQDKTGKDIYGSKGDMLGGDRVDYGPAIGVIKWSDDNAQWRIYWADLDLAFNNPLVSRRIIILQDPETD